MELQGKATKEQIDQWKTEHPEGVHEVVLKEKPGTAIGVFYLKEPDDLNYNMIISLLTEKKIVQAGETALAALYVGGMPVDKENKKLYRTMCTAAVARVDYYETEAVKL